MIRLQTSGRSLIALGMGFCSIVSGCAQPDEGLSPSGAMPPPTAESPRVPPPGEGAPSGPAAETSDCRLSVQVLSEAGRGASGIALDDNNVYIKSRRGVQVVSKTGGELAPFAGAPPAFAPADRVIDGTSEYGLQEGALVRLAGDGSRFQLARVDQVESECFAVTQKQGFLYWTGADGILMSVPTGGGFPLFVAGAGASDCDDDYEGLAVAADETHVYWIAGQPRRRSSDEESLSLYKTCR